MMRTTIEESTQVMMSMRVLFVGVCTSKQPTETNSEYERDKRMKVKTYECDQSNFKAQNEVGVEDNIWKAERFMPRIILGTTFYLENFSLFLNDI